MALPVALFAWRPPQRPVACNIFKGLFDGFTLVDHAECKEAEYRQHGVKPIGPMSEYRPGICYVYLVHPGNGEPIFAVLEQRLRKIDARISHSPSQNHDEVYPMVGGPLFHINFAKDGHDAVIAAVFDPGIAGDRSLRKEYRLEDYILRFDR
jgi:hypothetical protein